MVSEQGRYGTVDVALPVSDRDRGEDTPLPGETLKSSCDFGFPFGAEFAIRVHRVEANPLAQDVRKGGRFRFDGFGFAPRVRVGWRQGLGSGIGRLWRCRLFGRFDTARSGSILDTGLVRDR